MGKSKTVSPDEKPHKSSEPSVFDAAAKMQIRQFRQDDLEPVLEIQTAIRTLAVWRGRDYEQLAADPQGLLLVAESEARILPEIVGFSAFYRLDKESELWNVAVHPSHRRQGIARALLREGCRRLAESGVRRVFLEVRESNLPAVELYYSFGFELLGRRKEYYLNPKEDALVLVYKLVQPEL